MSREKRRKAFWYVAAVVGLAMSFVAWRTDSQVVLANQASNSALSARGDLITHVHDLEGGKLRVVVIDPQTRTMGIYDIEQGNGQGNGKIQLKSVRRISADLQMLEFNSGEPSPEEIQSRLDQR